MTPLVAGKFGEWKIVADFGHALPFLLKTGRTQVITLLLDSLKPQ
jgi:hypothetical protein